MPHTLINLENLECHDTHISSLPDSLVSLKILDCSMTPISVLPDTFKALERLNISHTDIKILPDYKLKWLWCSSNTHITKIPENSLKVLKSLHCPGFLLDGNLTNVENLFSNKLIINRHLRIFNAKSVSFGFSYRRLLVFTELKIPIDLIRHFMLFFV